MSLSVYTRKRNFGNTPEPKAKGGRKSAKLSFVVQRHDASRLHFDFRLELDGVLKSWAIPKGPSLNPAEKRLAVQVEDHPLEYGKFEGEIPEGNYGAGTVEIWDKGYYTPDPEVKNSVTALRKGLKAGSMKVILHGEKLNGSFALVQLKKDGGKNWLLIKHRDEFADDDFAITNAKSKTVRASGKPVSIRSKEAKARKYSEFVKPMLATLTDKPFDNPEWIFELKWDGYRAIAELNGKNLRLYSRNGLPFDSLYPKVADALRGLNRKAIVDGEIVVLDENGKPNFQKLQHYSDNQDMPIVYYVFDCLAADGKDLTDLPLVERKNILKQLLPENEIIKFSDHVEGSGVSFFKEAVKLNMEGIIGKLANSTYEKNRRTTNWLKIKNHNTQEAIIAGYTSPKASRKYFGALIFGRYKNKKLVYLGHAGTGYTDSVLKEVYQTMQPFIRDTSPFEEKVPVNDAVTWLEPSLVCNVKYTELTEQGIMRHPVFMGLRIDKPAKEVNLVESKKKTAVKAPARRTRQPKENKSSKPVDVDAEIEADGHRVKITNQDKIYWPDEGYTKGDVLDYYNKVSTLILPYLKDRPQSLRRNPNGITGKGFFQKDAGNQAPTWVKRVPIRAESTNKDVNYILCNDRATLLYLNNLGCIEINPWNSRIRKPDNPDYLILDIDPSARNTFDEVVDVALAVKDVLDAAGATAYCKTSGATGLHIYIPLHAAYTYEAARPFAELVARMVAEQMPATATLERSLSKRKNRIYVDYLQNSKGQTLSSVYSLRPVPGASVSTPLLWKEVRHGLSPSDFNIKNVHSRLKRKGDLFAGVLTEKTSLIKCLKKLESRRKEV